MKRPARDRIDWDVAIRLYREERIPIAAIARKFGVSWKATRAGLLDHGVALRELARPDSPEVVALYHAWHRVRKRFGKGVPWRDFREFSEAAIRNGFRKGLAFVLKDPRKPPSDDNLVWVDRSQAAKMRDRRHPKPTRTSIEAFGETKSLSEWVRDPRFLVSRALFSYRRKLGAAPEIAMTAKPGKLPETSRASERENNKEKEDGEEEKREGGGDGRRSEGKREGRERERERKETRERRGDAIDWREAARLYKKGVAPPEIAKIVGCSVSGLHAGMRRRGVAVRQRAGITASPIGRRLNDIWVKLKRRCEAAKRKVEPSVEDEAMRIAASWRTFQRFYRWAIARGYSPGMRLVRVDARKAFSQWNCRWEAVMKRGESE